VYQIWRIHSRVWTVVGCIRKRWNSWRLVQLQVNHSSCTGLLTPRMDRCMHRNSFLAQAGEACMHQILKHSVWNIETRAVLSPANRAKPCKFRYVKSLRNFMWKLCYRKDDRAMRRIRGCPENLRDSLTTPTATIPKIFHGLLFRSTLWMFLQNLKSVALPVPEIIGGTQKIWAATGYAHAPFSPKFFYVLLFGLAL